MLDAQVGPSVATFNTMISAAMNKQEYEMVVMLWRKVGEAGLTPSGMWRAAFACAPLGGDGPSMRLHIFLPSTCISQSTLWFDNAKLLVCLLHHSGVLQRRCDRSSATWNVGGGDGHVSLPVILCSCHPIHAVTE